MKNRAIIKIHYACNNNCNFCHCHDKRNMRKGYGFDPKLSRAKELGVEEILLSGGEPTINKELFRMISSIKARGMGFGFISNGRMFSNEKFANDVLKKKPGYFYISLHSSKEHIHDRMTNVTGSWRQTLKGIKNIVDGGNPCDMIVNSVVTKDNIYNLDEQVRLLSKMGVQNIKFSFPELKGKMIENKDLYPNPDAASEKISAALDICEEEGKNGLYDGLPFCYLPEKHQSKLDNLDTNDIYYMSEFFEKGFFRTDMGEREKHFECLRCSFHDICPGFQLQSHFNARPIIKKVPEKIVFSRKYEKKENPRSITLKNNGESTYRYEERYFRSYDIDRIKDKGNVLLYRPSGKNFLENLEILEHNKTDGRFTPTGISFYDKAKKAIERELYGLNGRILDVGFGGLIFYDIFRKIKMSGDVSYVGIDPDKENVKYAKERFPGEDFRMCGIEDIDKEPEYHNHFDAIVMIGCYNHFEQLEQAIKAAEHMIDEEGKIIIFENDLMAILDEEDTYNEKEQKNEVTSKTILEHYRNHDIEEASRFIEGLGLKIEKKDDYGIFWTIVVRGKR